MRISPIVVVPSALIVVLAGCSTTLPQAPVVGSTARLHANAAAVAMWATNPANSYLIGTTATGALVDAVDVGKNGCANPYGIQVDAAQNVWLWCPGAMGYSSGKLTSVQKYSRDGGLIGKYRLSALSECPPKATRCSYTAYSLGGAANATNVFAAVQHSETFFCPYTDECESESTFGFEWWTIGKSKAVSGIKLWGHCLNPSCTITMGKIGFMDLDKTGDIYFDYYWYNSSSSGSHGSGWGVAEITNPTTTSWSLVQVLAPDAGPWKCPEGIYVSTSADGTQSLNVIDSCVRKVFRYKLPIKPHERYTVLGPTPQSSGGSGKPVIGGFGLGDKYIAIGDEGNSDGDTWVDYGDVNSNKWSRAMDKDYAPEVVGAALTPSDKPK